MVGPHTWLFLGLVGGGCLSSSEGGSEAEEGEADEQDDWEVDSGQGQGAAGLDVVEECGEVPLTPRALAAVAAVPPRLDSRLLFPAARGGYIGLDSWRSREWYPALEAAGLAKRGPYALRHSFVTHALAAGVPIFDVARFAGTSVQMIERTYGHLAKGSESHARELLAVYAADRLGQERATTGEEP